MSNAIFLDTNIIMKDYNMNGRDFEDLFEMIEEYSLEQEYFLCITEMNKYELMSNYRKKISETIRIYKKFYNNIVKLVEDKNKFDIKPREKREEFISEYEKRITDIFFIEKSSSDATRKGIERMYLNMRPFRENKEEIKDAIIWETIEEYAENHPDSYVFFISENHKDFAKEDAEFGYMLHEDFNDLDGRIKYFKSIRAFLTKGVEYLKTHVFEHQDWDELLEKIERYIYWAYPNNLQVVLESYFSNYEFETDYFSGWGIDPTINNIIEIKQNEYEDVISTEDSFIIPCILDLEMEYNVQTKSPVYDLGDEEEYITSDPQYIELTLTFEAVYNKEDKKIVQIESIDII